MALTANDDRTYTLEEFEDLPEELLNRLELVRGWLVREPRPAPLHGRVHSRLVFKLESYMESSGEGVVLTDTGFLIAKEPPTVRIPDISVVTTLRIPPDPYAGGFWRGAPDLAIEILSPSNTARGIAAKVTDYIAAGAGLVWVVDPLSRCVTVHESAAGQSHTIDGDVALNAAPVLGNLRLRLEDIFVK